jgi:hypothetical protein
MMENHQGLDQDAANGEAHGEGPFQVMCEQRN